MTLIFGNLVQSFVGFGIALEEAKAGDTSAQAQLPVAAAAFRHIAASDAAKLVYIGELIRMQHVWRNVFSPTAGIAMFVCTFTYMCIWVSTTLR
jgi:ATP-binding cassette, subfamily B (MDR/TAP), member 1